MSGPDAYDWDLHRRNLEKRIKMQRQEIKRLWSVEQYHWQFVHKMREERRTPDPAQIRADALRGAFQFPDDVIELAKRIGRAEWGATEPKTAEDHGADTVHTVKKTAAHFGQIDRQAMHGLYVEGTGIVICHAGVSPNSPEIARVLTGLWNMLCDAALLDTPLSPTAVDNSPAPDAGGTP